MRISGALSVVKALEPGPTSTSVALLAGSPPLQDALSLQGRASQQAVAHHWVADLAMLVKARLTLMVLFTVAIGFVLGAGGIVDGWLLFNTLLGTALLAAGASALNQWLERDTDALMRRTKNRPLPAGRMSAATALRFGVLTACAGMVYLVVLVNPLTALLGVATLASYICIYTPLKRRTGLNTMVGAIPGALPPVMGWAAATGTLDPGAAALFVILFLWQFPHFWAIAWMHRQDYARAGMRMVPVEDREGGRMTGRLMMQNCLVLLPASLLPATLGMAGPRYVIAALLVGGLFLLFAVRFWMLPTQQRGRHVLWASLVYLPVVLTLLLVDGPFLL